MKYLDLTGLGEVWANIKSYISSKIPTKTSQLQNDSNYATISQLPSKTSQLTNDSDFTTNAKLATKQDTISDLATIRSGASKGATAVQPSELTTKANIADTVLKTNTDYTFRNYNLNSLNIDEKYNENYAVGISVDGYGTRPVGGWTNIINFCTNHFLTQLCIPIHANKDTDCMYIRTRWTNDATWGEWRKSANDNSVVHKSGDEIVNGTKTFTSEIVNTSPHFRHIFGDYGTFWRQDGYNLYLMLTNSGDQYGNWNDFRPLIVNLATGICSISGTAGGVAWTNVSDRPTKLSQFTNDSGYLTSGNVVDRTSNQSINGEKTFNNVIQAKDRLSVYDGINLHSFVDISKGWIEMSEPNYCYIDFKHEGPQDYLGRIGLNPNNILFLETINGAPIMANGKNIVRSVNGVNADNNGNVTIQGFSNGIGEIIQGYYVPNGIVQKSGSVYFGTLVQPEPGAVLSDFRDINITITDEFYPEVGKIYDYSQIFSTLYLHSYDSEYAANDSFYGNKSPTVDKWFGGWIKVAGSNLVRNSGKYLCTSVSPYGYAVTLRYNLTMTCEKVSYYRYECKIVSKTVPQNQMTVTSKATFMRVG